MSTVSPSLSTTQTKPKRPKPPSQAFDQAVLYYPTGNADPPSGEEEQAGFRPLKVLDDLQAERSGLNEPRSTLDFPDFHNFHQYDAHAHIALFNQLDFAGPQDRLQAADAEAHALFHTMTAHAAYAGPHQMPPLRPYRIEQYRDLFRDALTGSDTDPRHASAAMDTIHQEAAAYLRGQTPPESGDLHLFSSHPEYEYSHDRPGDFAPMVERHWNSAYLAAYRSVPDQESDARSLAYQGVTSAYTERLRAIDDHGSEQDLQQAIMDLKAQNFQFAVALQENTGFIIQKGYQPPDLPQEFSTTAQADTYVAQVENKIEELRAGQQETHPVYFEAAETLLQDARTEIESWKQSGNHLTSDYQFHSRSAQIHNVAQGIALLLQPKQQQDG